MNGTVQFGLFAIVAGAACVACVACAACAACKTPRQTSHEWGLGFYRCYSAHHKHRNPHNAPKTNVLGAVNFCFFTTWQIAGQNYLPRQRAFFCPINFQFPFNSQVEYLNLPPNNSDANGNNTHGNAGIS